MREPPRPAGDASTAVRRVLDHERRLLAALDEIGRLASAEPDLRRLGAAVTAAIRDALGLAYVSLVSVDRARGLAEYVADATDFAPGVKPGDTQPLARGLVGRCAREGRTVLVADVRADPDYVEIIPGVVSELVVPVLARGEVIAVLNCESRDAADLRERAVFVEVAANRLGVALENAGLLREREGALDVERRAARQLAVLNEIARLATSDLSLRPMLQRVTDAMATHFGWEFVACATIDLVERRFVCEGVTSSVPTDVRVGYGRALGSGVVGEVALSGQPLLLDDVRTHPTYVETLPGARSELCVPVRAGGKVIAVLNLESTRPAAFHDQLPLLETVAEQVAGAIASARLYGEVTHRAAQLEMLADVSRTAMEAPELTALLDRVVAYVHVRMGLPLVAVLLVNESATELELVAHAGDLPLTVVKGARWPLGKGIVSRAIRQGEPQLLLDVRADPDYVAISPSVTSEYAIPIRFRNRTLGVVNIEATTPEAFGRDTLLVLRMFVDQVAGAIYTASVNRRLAQANRRLLDLFSKYVAPDLAELLLVDPERFRNRGERRDVTVVFADIRGFTRLSQRLDSQKVLALLNDAYPVMAEPVFRHRGSINRFLGDGFMAVFGVPERLADHRGAAIDAALEMQRGVDGLSAKWEAVAGEPLRVVCVANSGPVTVGNIGDPRHMEFTVLGDAVNVASRLEAEAKARDARILVTDSVYAPLAGRIAGEAIGDVTFRGRDGTVALWRLL